MQDFIFFNTRDSRRRNAAFTLVELLVVIAIVGLLIALLLPAIQYARELARRATCSNNLKQITLAVLTFHETHNRYPASVFDPVVDARRVKRYGIFVLILPFMEQQALFDTLTTNPIQNMQDVRDIFDVRKNEKGNILLPTLLCPSDTKGVTRFTNARQSDGTFLAFSNYRACRGDLVAQTEVQNTNQSIYLGATGYDGYSCVVDGCCELPEQYNLPRSWVRPRDHVGDNRIVTSGTSNTIAFSEGLIGTDNPRSRTFRDTVASGISGYYWEMPMNCRNVQEGNKSGFFANQHQSVFSDNNFLGRRIWDNIPVAYAFNALLPPNSPSCSNSRETGLISASSAHRGGVNVSFLDGAVRFIGDSIQTGSAQVRLPNGTVQTVASLALPMAECEEVDMPCPMNRKEAEPVDACDHEKGMSPACGCDCGKPHPTMVCDITGESGTPAYPTNANERFSYGVWAELGAINSTEMIPALW